MKLLEMLGLTKPKVAPELDVTELLGVPLEAETLQNMRCGVIAIADRSKGTVELYTRYEQSAMPGCPRCLIAPNGMTLFDTSLKWGTYGLRDGWQAYTVRPFAPIMRMKGGRKA